MRKSTTANHQRIINLANEKGITLDGKKAVVQGARLAYAIIRTTDNKGASYSWSWNAVERIISRDGKFNS